MEFSSLMLLRSTVCATVIDRRHFDNAFPALYSDEKSLEMRVAFDLVADSGILPTLAVDLIYAQLYSPEDTDDDALLDEDIFSAVACVLSLADRKKRFQRNRLNWRRHVRYLLKEGRFRSMYQMSYQSFKELLELLRPFLVVDVKQSQRPSAGQDPIGPEIVLHCLLRYLAGGSRHDIRTSGGMSIASFYRAVHKGIDAVNSCDQLKLVFPSTNNDLKETSKGFEAANSYGVLNGCVGALDGWLCGI